MAKFKKGDRVVNTEDISFLMGIKLPKGASGTVAEDDDTPYVEWDDYGVLPRDEDYLKLIVEQPKVVQSQTPHTYTFSYTDDTRNINHSFSADIEDYGLEDVIAEFRLFLLGLGFAEEHATEYIDDRKL